MSQQMLVLPCLCQTAYMLCIVGVVAVVVVVAVAVVVVVFGMCPYALGALGALQLAPAGSCTKVSASSSELGSVPALSLASELGSQPALSLASELGSQPALPASSTKLSSRTSTASSNEATHLCPIFPSLLFLATMNGFLLLLFLALMPLWYRSPPLEK